MYRTFLAWLPLIGLALLQLIPRDYWCAPVQPGGLELACGYDDARPSAQAASDVYRLLCIAAYLYTVWFAYKRVLPKWGWAGLVVSSLLFAVCVWMKFAYAGEDSP